MRERVVIDIRESYHATAREATLRIPLGALLADPTRLPRAQSYVLVGHDRRDASFAAGFLQEHGIDAMS